MLRSKGMISPPLPISRPFRKTWNHCYLESSIPQHCRSNHAFLSSLPSAPLPFTTFSLAPFEVCKHLPISLYSGTSPVTVHLCLLCSHSSVHFNTCRSQGSTVLWEGHARQPDQETVVYTGNNPQTSRMAYKDRHEQISWLELHRSCSGKWHLSPYYSAGVGKALELLNLHSVFLVCGLLWLVARQVCALFWPEVPTSFWPEFRD